MTVLERMYRLLYHTGTRLTHARVDGTVPSLGEIVNGGKIKTLKAFYGASDITQDQTKLAKANDRLFLRIVSNA